MLVMFCIEEHGNSDQRVRYFDSKKELYSVLQVQNLAIGVTTEPKAASARG